MSWDLRIMCLEKGGAAPTPLQLSTALSGRRREGIRIWRSHVKGHGHSGGTGPQHQWFGLLRGAMGGQGELAPS